MKKFGIILLIALSLMVVGCQKSATSSDNEKVEVKMARGDLAPHGKYGYATIVVAMSGDKIVGVSLDEYQVLNKADIKAGVPNSDNQEGVGAAFKDPEKVLASKRVNNEYYSNLMKDKAGSTVSIADNYDAIEKFCVGKTIKELEDVANSENPVDAVSGATLVDTKGYLEAIIEVAKKIN